MGDIMGFPGGSDGKESAWSEGDLAQSLGREDPLEEGWQTTPVFLPGEFYVQKSLAGYSPQGWKESVMTGQLSTAQHVF